MKHEHGILLDFVGSPLSLGIWSWGSPWVHQLGARQLCGDFDLQPGLGALDARAEQR